MRNNARLNGCDYLMLGFYYELRRCGFAGNSCQIVLEIGSAISLDALKKSLGDVINHFPILRARPGGMVFPKWNSLGHAATAPQIRIYRDEPALARKIFNEPLAMNRGELLRFDLIQHEDEHMSVIFTWMHALMDAPGAEHFLALVGRAEAPLSAPQLPQPRRPKKPLRERC